MNNCLYTSVCVLILITNSIIAVTYFYPLQNNIYARASKIKYESMGFTYSTVFVQCIIYLLSSLKIFNFFSIFNKTSKNSYSLSTFTVTRPSETEVSHQVFSIFVTKHMILSYSENEYILRVLYAQQPGSSPC